jgi:hypothetical protein
VARLREKSSSVDAGRIAASRRGRRDAPAERAPKAPAAERGKAGSERGKKGKGGRGKKSAPSSPAGKAFKLLMLVVLMAGLGFGTVLILDVGLTLVGSLKLGNLTFNELGHKVADRVFDHDVPEVKKKTGASSARSKPQSRAATEAPTATPAARAPLPAPAPDDYAKEVALRPDPEVADAKARLNRLLQGL